MKIDIPLPTREEMLSAYLPVEEIRTAERGYKVTYRFETPEARDTFGDVARRILTHRSYGAR